MTDAATPHDLRLHLRTADRPTARRAVPVLVQAYARTTLAQWACPTVDERGSRLRVVVGQLLDDAMANGCVTLAYQGATTVGAVLWRNCPAQEGARPVLPAVPLDDPADTRLAVLADRLTSCHPPEPHEHLQAVAVLPGREGQRIASTLLAGATAQPALPRFLLTTGPLRRLLHQLGYQPYGKRVTPPNGGPAVQPMWCATPTPTPEAPPHTTGRRSSHHERRPPICPPGPDHRRARRRPAGHRSRGCPVRRRPTDLARALEEAEFWHDHCVPRHAAMILRPALQPYAPAGRCADRQVIRAAVLFAATAFDTPDSQLAYALFAERNSRCELGAQDPLTLSAMTTLAEVTVQQNRSGEAITVCGSIIEAHCARGDLPAALTWRRARAGLLHGTGRCGYAQDEIAVCLELAGTLPTAADRQTAARQALIWRTVILAVCGDASAALAVLREHSALLPPVGSRERRTDEATIAGAIHARTTVHPAVCTRPGDSQPFTQHPLAFWTTAVRTAVQS